MDIKKGMNEFQINSSNLITEEEIRKEFDIQKKTCFDDVELKILRATVEDMVYNLGKAEYGL